MANPFRKFRHLPRRLSKAKRQTLPRAGTYANSIKPIRNFMKTSRKRTMRLVLSAIVITCGISQQSFAADAATQTRSPAIDPNYSDEVLAGAPFRNGRGSIEIRRGGEENAVAVVTRGRVGDTYSAPRESLDLPLADRTASVYWDLTGQQLPRQAYDALQKIEALKAQRAPEESEVIAQPGRAEADSGPRAACVNIATDPSDYFYFDCYVYGEMIRKASGTDDVCLLAAAIKGNIGMQVSYRAVNGTYYNNFHSDVAQGHYVAYSLHTGVRRTRKGYTYNASASDYSRYSYGGDYKLLGTNFEQLEECQDLAEH